MKKKVAIASAYILVIVTLEILALRFFTGKWPHEFKHTEKTETIIKKEIETVEVVVEKPILVKTIEYKWVWKEELSEESTEQVTTEEPKSVEPAYIPIETAEPATEQPTEARDETSNYMGVYELTAYVETGYACADGVYPEVGYTVASNDPALWHHWIYIEGVGERYVHDTGGMSTNVIDIYVGDYDSAIQFGRRSAGVYIIE